MAWPRSAQGAARRAHALKRALLRHLADETYVKLAPSRVAGVGVVALRDIPSGIDPFRPANAHLCTPEPSVLVTENELDALPALVREHTLDFFAPIDDPEDAKRPFRTQSGARVYGIHACGTAVLDASWFVNHSGEQPNLELVNYEGSAFNSFRTLRPVRAGEELLHDYARSFPEIHARCVAATRQCKNE